MWYAIQHVALCLAVGMIGLAVLGVFYAAVCGLVKA